MHIEYGDLKFVVAIESGRVLKGSMAPRLKKLLDTWRREHVEELMKAWADAQNHKNPKRIRPLE